MTKLSIPTYVAARFVLPKKRNDDTVYMKTVVDVDIRDVDDDQAPVLFSIKDESRKIGSYLPFATSDGSPCLVRKFEGNFLAKRWRVDDVVARILHDGQEKNWEKKFGNLLGGNYADEAGTVTVGLSGSVSKVADNHADAERKFGPFRKWADESQRTYNAINDRCSELIIVDGWVYEKVGEPVLSITLDNEPEGFRLRVIEDRNPKSRYASIYDDRSGSSLPRFGIDEIEKARAVAAGIAEKSGCGLVDGLEVEVVAPWEVRFRGESEVLLHAADDVVQFGLSNLKDLNGNFGLAWHDLVSSMYVDNVVTPPLIDALQRIASMESSGLLKRNARGEIEKSWYAERESGILETVTEALDLWASRNHRGYEWSNEAFAISSTHEKGAFAYEINSLVGSGLLAEGLGVPTETFDNLTTEAAAGRGHLIAIHNQAGPIAAAFVIDGEDGPEVVETITRHGAPSAKAVDLAVRHARSGSHTRKDLAADLDLLNL